MSSIKQPDESSWVDLIRFKKQSTLGKIILVSFVLVLGTIIVFISLTLFLHRWSDFGIYSLWILFGWFFFAILTYVSVKLISLLMHKGKLEVQNLENQKQVEQEKD